MIHLTRIIIILPQLLSLLIVVESLIETFNDVYIVLNFEWIERYLSGHHLINVESMRKHESIVSKMNVMRCLRPQQRHRNLKLVDTFVHLGLTNVKFALLNECDRKKTPSAWVIEEGRKLILLYFFVFLNPISHWRNLVDFISEYDPFYLFTFEGWKWVIEIGIK